MDKGAIEGETVATPKIGGRGVAGLTKFDKYIRRLLPSGALLARSPAFAILSRGIDLTITPLARYLTGGQVLLPPSRFIARTGVGKWYVTPHLRFILDGYTLLLYLFGNGYAGFDSTIVDIGSGVGKLAVPLLAASVHGRAFKGHFFGFDVDAEMIDWCQRNFPEDRFTFTHVDAMSKVYNPQGSDHPSLSPCSGESIDLVFSNSLFSHLLPADIERYMRESYRVLRPSGKAFMSFFCIDDLLQLGALGNRWTFDHRMGDAYVENLEYPEAAVGYERSWMISLAERIGFCSAEVLLGGYQSALKCIK